MKRPSKKRYGDLWKCFPIFFWKKCCKCNCEFRREKGWRAITGPYHGGTGQFKYLCNDCAPTREEADNFFLGYDHSLPMKPPEGPPPPPPPKKGNTVEKITDLPGHNLTPV